MTSLATNAVADPATNKVLYTTATFNGKASVQEVTNPLAPVSVDGNASLQITLTDRGEPGTSDTIGITV